MKTLNLSLTDKHAPHFLFLGAHSDDIEIGCGGSILRLLEAHPHATVTWVVFSACGPRKAEALAGADLFLRCAGVRNVQTYDFTDGFLPYRGEEVKWLFESLKKQFQPDLIFTHARDDLHQDHRLINDLTWNTFRDHLILEYEIPKYDDDLGNPNVFIPMDEALVKQKVAYLMQAFTSQQDKPWFTGDTFVALMRLRGVQSRSPGHYAEAFYGRKLIFL